MPASTPWQWLSPYVFPLPSAVDACAQIFVCALISLSQAGAYTVWWYFLYCHDPDFPLPQSMGT